MSNLPAFITFTGLDAWTDLDRVEDLSRRYPIEWGILFSPKRQGVEPRYLALGTVQDIVIRNVMGPLRLAAHLCGGHARDVLAGYRTGLERLLVGNFGRFQVNTADPTVSPVMVRAFAEDMNSAGRGILQCRGVFTFPTEWDVDWLADASGGRGEMPSSWPMASVRCPFVGYAGGLGPETIAEALKGIRRRQPRGRSYWLDMESRIRTDDRLDLDKCEAVCRAVYGNRATPEPAPSADPGRT